MKNKTDVKIDKRLVNNNPHLRVKMLTEKLMNFTFFACGAVSIGFVALITVYMFYSGLPAMLEVGVWDFITGLSWAPNLDEYGIMALILCSICATFGAAILGVPIGVLTAVFLSKVASKRVSNLVRPAVELLAGIPSVVYGLIGAMLLVPFIADFFNQPKGSGLLAVILVLTVMILPSIISVSETALNAVDESYEAASLALGATKMETFFKVSLPAARSGVAAGIVLGIGRAIGEAMAVAMVAGNVANLPALFQSVSLLTTSIAKDMGYASGLHREALFSIALVLYFFILFINAIMNRLLKKGVKK